MEPVEAWIRAYGLKPHPEGGLYCEAYESSAALPGGRAAAGSIYFLLRGEEISHLHRIDCEEIWFYHAGGGLAVTVIDPADGGVTRLLLGPDAGAGQRFSAAVPKGALFASENLDKNAATLVSCVTAPQFDEAGFRMIGRDELFRVCPARAEELSYLLR